MINIAVLVKFQPMLLQVRELKNWEIPETVFSTHHRNFIYLD